MSREKKESKRDWISIVSAIGGPAGALLGALLYARVEFEDLRLESKLLRREIEILHRDYRTHEELGGHSILSDRERENRAGIEIIRQQFIDLRAALDRHAALGPPGVPHGVGSLRIPEIERRVKKLEGD